MRLLHPDPARRTASAAEAQGALAFLDARPRLKTLARRTAVAAALAFVALLATVGGWTLRRSGTSARGGLAGPAKVQMSSRAEPATAVATGPSVPAPPNVQAIVKQSLDQAPDFGRVLVPSMTPRAGNARREPSRRSTAWT